MLEQKIMTLYQNLYFQKIRVKKLITMLKAIVIDKETDIYKISKKANTTDETVKKYINSKELILEFLTEEEYNQFIPYRDKINSKSKTEKEIEKYNIVKSLITDVLETRLKLEEICIRNNITIFAYDKLIADKKYLVDNFGDDIIAKLKFRIEETKIIRMSAPRDKKIIEEAWDLKVAKDKIHYLDSYEYKILKAISNYLMSEANMAYVANKLEMPQKMVYNYITDPKAKDLIKEDYFDKLQAYINIENVLSSSDLNAREDLIKQAMLVLKQSDHKLTDSYKNSEIPYGLLEKILNDPLMGVTHSKEEIQQLKELFVKPEENQRHRR